MVISGELGQRLWLRWELTKREMAQRYRGTLFGLIWPVLYALLFLSVFAFEFVHVLHVRWGAAQSSDALQGVLRIFCGMVSYLFVAEVVQRSPAQVWC